MIDLQASIGEIRRQLRPLRSTDEATAALEVDYLLSAVTEQSRGWLFAHDEEGLSPLAQQRLQAVLDGFVKAVPLAYLLGTQPFMSLSLQVTPATLIPRADTACLVTWITEQFDHKTDMRVVDLGTGSGAIALAIATERPHWSVTATDMSVEAIAVAKANAQQLGLSVRWCLGDWWQPLLGEQFDLIVSNPPYIADDDPHLTALTHEPSHALVSAENGLYDLRVIISQAPHHARPGTWLVVEHGNQQAAAVAALMTQAGWQAVTCHQDLARRPRFTVGCWKEK